jgi:hypothetical protein
MSKEQDIEAAKEALAAAEGEPEPETAPTPAWEVLNKSKAVGYVDGVPGVKYWQDGKYFDAAGRFVRKE